MAEERQGISPYSYVQNNPLNRIDPTGMLDESVQGPLTDIWKLFKKEDGTYRAEKQHINDGKNDQIYLVMGDDGVANSMYQGAEAEFNMNKAGISISDRDNGVTTMSAVKDATVDFWTSDEYRTKAARETMVNYVTSVVPAEGLVVGMLAQTGKVARGFKSFSAFKNAMGSAGKGKAWHHIVEQNPANIAKFGENAIHNTSNLMKLPHGKGTIHARISGHYSSKQPFTGGKTVRQWLNTKSFDYQRNYGLQKLKDFGYKP